MCVGAKSHICLICLLLSSWHANAEDSDVGATSKLYDDVPTKSGHQSENAEHTEQLYYMEKDYFLTKLMEKYGNGEEMKYDGFEHLLYHLGLGGTIRFDHGINCHYVENSSEFLQIHLHHNHSEGAIPQSTHCQNEMDKSDGHSQNVFNHSHSHAIHDHTHIVHSHDHSNEDHEQKVNEKHDHENNDGDGHGHDGHSHGHEDHQHDADDQMHHDHELNSEDHDHVHTENEHNLHQLNETTNKEDLKSTNISENDDDVHDLDKETNDHVDHDEHKSEQNTSREHTPDSEGHDHDHVEDHGDHDHKHDTDKHNHDHEHNDEETTTREQTTNSAQNEEHDHAENIEDHGDHIHEHDHDHKRKKRGSGSDECLSPKVLLRIVQKDDQPKSLTKEMFKELCPSLIYQIDSDSCHSSHNLIEHDELDGNHDGFHGDHDHDHDEHDHDAHAESQAIDLAKVPPKVWGFSTIAVVIISLVGLLGVAVIPIMQKVFYNHMLQFLVALAVGALSGDALLHLLPHAITGGHGDEQGGHSHDAGGHAHDTDPIYKGLVGLLGIYFFFFTERVLTIFTEYKRRKKQTKNRKKFMKDEEMVKVGEKLANTECDGMMMSIHPNKALRGYADEAHSEHCTISLENTTRISHEHGHRQNCQEETCIDGDENTSMIGSLNSTPRTHGHGHSHGVDGVPDSVASVAWMVILGDGIHNFSDGLAIGAAFVNSITGGFSTSIAVFCHELPHEIGDFAMLLRAGMSPKQAIIYNCLSSILCFIGMLIGVAIGNLTGASLWIFAIVGGMFLYIALVDMLPELSSVETKKGEHPLCHLLLQGVGMCIGAGIMLTIALYEEDLKTMLE